MYFGLNYDSVISSVKINTLAYSKKLYQPKLLFVNNKLTYMSEVGGCDGWNGRVDCNYNFNNPIPETNYKLIVRYAQLGVRRNPDPTLIPFLQITGSIIDTSITKITFTGKYVRFNFVVNYISYHCVYVHNSLFDTT